jgi:hypothetical protein
MLVYAEAKARNITKSFIAEWFCSSMWVDAFAFALGEWLRCCVQKWKVSDVCGSNEGMRGR